MSKPLFRQVAMERLSTPDQLDQTMRITAPAAWVGLAALIVLMIGGTVWSMLGSAPVKVAVHGMLLSPAGVLDIVSESQGRVARLLVGPGDSVALEQVVALVAQPDLEQRLATVRAEFAERLSQRDRVGAFQVRENAARQAAIEQRRANAEQSIGFLKERLTWLAERETYEDEMLKRGQIIRQRHIDTKIEKNMVRESIAREHNAIKDATLEENSAAIARERELLNLDLQVDSKRREIENLEDQLQRVGALRSPYAGHIVEVKVNPGEMAAPGIALFSLLPDDPGPTAAPPTASGDRLPLVSEDRLVAVMYASPADGKKVRPGMAVQIAPATVKREEYGFMLGTVESVAEIPSTAAGMQRVLKNPRLVESLMTDGAPFQITVRLLRDPASPSGFRWSSSGPALDINPGTLADGTIAVREVRLISLAIPALEPLLKPHSRQGEAHAGQP